MSSENQSHIWAYKCPLVKEIDSDLELVNNIVMDSVDRLDRYRSAYVQAQTQCRWLTATCTTLQEMCDAKSRSLQDVGHQLARRTEELEAESSLRETIELILGQREQEVAENQQAMEGISESLKSAETMVVELRRQIEQSKVETEDNK